jgi:hypothetical protein
MDSTVKAWKPGEAGTQASGCVALSKLENSSWVALKINQDDVRIKTRMEG